MREGPRKPYLAFDFGAGSGRAVLGHIHSGAITIEEVRRFANKPSSTGVRFTGMLRVCGSKYARHRRSLVVRTESLFCLMQIPQRTAGFPVVESPSEA